MTLTPIETRYAGCRFRSRTEARWGVFFDHLKVQWQYEAQGYRLTDGTWYLPDFWLPEMEIHVEVKGQMNRSDAEKVVGISKDLMPGSYPTLVVSDIPMVDARGPHFVTVSPSFKPNMLEFHNVSLLLSTAGQLECRVKEAYTAARSARFEHGEQGAA